MQDHTILTDVAFLTLHLPQLVEPLVSFWKDS